MKTILAAIAALGLGSLSPGVMAQTVACGVPPIPPIGCTTGSAQCVCDSNGNCHYIFVGCQ